MYKIMTPGPTQVAENVMKARSMPCTNPDLDIEFYDFYKKTCELISNLLKTENETIILSGEGILGLEAACASITEPGDKVLVIDNGIYGNGFKDFVEMYGGIPDVYTKDYRETINIKELEEFLKDNNDYKYATVVHCDTPSGILNDISQICPLLKKYGILTVVDSVSAMFGEYVKFDEYMIDILCGGSQKVVSAPPGLSFVTLSEYAKNIIYNRKTKIKSFYGNLALFRNYYKDKWFPYTMPISDIQGLRAAFENIEKDTDIVERHRKIAEYTRDELAKLGFKLYGKSGYSNTVTAFEVPFGCTDKEILLYMKEHCNIMLAGSFGEFSGKVIRIGHMGENARYDKINEVLTGLKEFKILNKIA